MQTKEFIKSLGLIGLYVFLNIIVGILIYMGENTSTLIQNLILLLGSSGILVAIMYFTRKKGRGKLLDFKKNYKKYLPIILKNWLIGFIGMMVVNYILVYLVIGDIASNEQANRTFLVEYPIYSIISMIIIAPLTEEWLFRLNFKDTIKDKWPFVLTTGLIFGAMHVILSATSSQELLYLIPYSIIGIAFGIIYYDTDNIYSSLCAHMLHNTISLIIIMLGM